MVNRRPLSYVLGELQRYRRDLLRVSDAAGEILVQGVFPLGDVDRALRVLSETLPIALQRYGPWITLIDARAK
ncbi:fec operon regulator FecR [compost metagenome]